MTIELGDFFVQALAAVGTLLAVIVAIRAANQEATDRRKAQKELADERARSDAERAAVDAARSVQEHRAQAELVIAWPDYAVEFAAVIGSDAGRWVINAGNYSNAPIFDVTVDAFDGQMRRTTGGAAVLPPGEVITLRTDIEARQAGVRARIEFRDLRGTRWRRYQDGRLEELNEHGQPI